MKLNRKNISDSTFWKQNGIKLPTFDIDAVRANTEKNPVWLHFGAGNIFKAFPARIYQTLLNEGIVKSGIISAETFDFEVSEIANEYDCLHLSVLMNRDGSLDTTLVASVVQALTSRTDNGDFEKCAAIFENPSLQMVSYTITEKGYALTNLNGDYIPLVERDIQNGPSQSVHAMSVLTSLLYRRYKAGAYALTVVSMDNCSHNGDKIKNAVLDIAGKWKQNGFTDEGFISYLNDRTKIAFPLTMIDKITPRPSEKVSSRLSAMGLENMDIRITAKKSYAAPFVNAETLEYLVVEDTFPNGRPPLEKAGVLFGTRDTVNKTETMKVGSCLNPLHTALAVTGCLLGYTSIAEEMNDPVLVKLIKKIGYDEGLKTAIDPVIIRPERFLDEVINERFVNPNIPDTPQRIATDTSQKLAVRYGKTIEAYCSRGDLNVQDLTGIPLAIAAWLRYLLGIDDSGKPMELSPDPLLADLKKELSGISLGSTNADVRSILTNKQIFGIDLYEAGLGEKVTAVFTEMLASPGAVRKTLEKYTA